MSKEKLNLKSKLNGNELDLSLCELSAVPVKEIAGLKKVSSLDLSCNRLHLLSDEFCIQLVALTTLDLSKNFLTCLPEQFGLLVNLQHLDLYRNQLQTLPLSFSQLGRLKWLDMKDNMLEEPLQRACGDCLDEKQCKTAATRVVAYMKQLATEHEKQQQQKLNKQKALREKQLAQEALEEQKKREEKKKGKERKKQKTATSEQGHNSENNFQQSAKQKAAHADKVKPKSKSGRSKFSCCRLLASIVSTLLITLLVSLVLVPQLCRNPPKSVPYSAEFCQKTYEAMLLIKVNETGPFYVYMKTFSEYGQTAVDHVAVQLKDFDYQKAMNDVSGTLQRLSASALTYLKVAGHIAYDLGYATFVIVSDYCVWIARGAQNAVENWPETWEKIKYVWRNMK